MRRALKQAIVFYGVFYCIDEIEKVLTGIGCGYYEVTALLFGNFLRWMQEK